MNSDYIMIERELLKAVLDENKRLKKELEQYKPKEKEQQNERQISILDYMKTLKKKGENKDE